MEILKVYKNSTI